jgi:hypothetical protein
MGELARAEEDCMQRLDDVEERFASLTREMGVFGSSPGITTHARRAIEARFASARVRMEKSLDVARAARAARAAATARGEKDADVVVASYRATPRTSVDDILCYETGDDAPPRDILKRWIVEHFDAPWPTPSMKRRLAEQTGFSVAQISNFFINARVRLWRPLVMELGEELEQASARIGTKKLKNGPPQRKKRCVAKRCRAQR